MSGYWKKRQEEKLFDVLDDADVSVEYIADIYYKASIHLNDQIQGVYDTYRTKNGISIQEAKILLNSLNDPNDYDELLRKLKSNPSGDERKEIIKKLDAPAYRYRIKRLQDSQYELDALMKNIYNVEKETSTLHYINAAYDGYYKDIYNIQHDTGIAFDFNELDPSFVDSMLKSRWSGENYSDRIWNNTTELASSLKEEMMMGLLTNKTEKMMQQTIIDKFMVGAYQARRLIETESAAMVSMADQLAFEEAGVDTEIFRAVHDFKTSKICQRMDGTVIERKNIEIGKNAPPMHPHCRSIMEPVIGYGIKYKRRQRNPITGRDEIVDADETYNQWLKRMQDDHDIDTVETFQKKTKNLSSDRRQYRLYKDVIGIENMPKSLEKFQDLKYNDNDKWRDLKKFHAFKQSNQNATYNDYLLHSINNYAPGTPLFPDKVNGYVLKDVKAKKDQNHIFERMLERNITSDELQEYVDNAKVMFNQWNGKRRLYISDKGASVVMLRGDDWIFKTGMKYTDYGENYMAILEVLKKWKK